MGTPIPPPFEPPPVPGGDACAICWGAGKPFGADGTPDSVSVNFSGINKGDSWSPGDGEPIEGLFEIPQSILSACFYLFQDAEWTITVFFDSDHTDITAESAIGKIHFETPNAAICAIAAINERDAEFIGGSAIIYIPGVE